MNSWKKIIVLLFVLSLTGCALSPKTESTKIASDNLLEKQLTALEDALEKSPRGLRNLVYVGSAQHSQSLAFQRDVLLVKRRLQEINSKVQTIILSNEIQTNQLTYPFATLNSLNLVFSRLATLSQKYPLTVVFLVSTHGNVDVLASNIANQSYPSIQSKHLRSWLDALDKTPTVVILSACFSGSFLPPLDNGQRLLLTAAAANRSSFGCAYQDENTYFVGALFGPAFDPSKTWGQNFDSAKVLIEKKEAAMKLGPASNPQGSFPVSFAGISIADFIKP